MGLALKARVLAGALLLCCGGCGNDPAAAGWDTVFDNLEGPILLAWGSAPDNVYFAGGTLGVGADNRPIALRFDGATWHRLDASLAGAHTLWSVGGSAADDVWFAGEQGVILHWDGAGFTRADVPATGATLFGLWASARDDAWAVGGLPTGGGAEDQDVLLHFDGQKWSRVEPPMRLGATYFKVSGTARNNVYVSGAGGLILHFNGTNWSFEDSGVHASLFSVAALGSEVLAVGGPPLAVLSRAADGKWSPIPGLTGTLANGVALGADGSAFVVAVGGRKYRRSDGAWIDESAASPRKDLHAVWADDRGGAFCVGGSFGQVGAPHPFGVIGHYGAAVPSSAPVSP